MKLQDLLSRRRLIVIAALVALLGTAFLLWRGRMPRPEKMTPGKFPEQIVYVRSNDDIVNCGAIFTPARDSAKPIAVVWLHGWGVNFYYPTYVGIGRALAEHGYAFISVNTRMHDIGTIAGERHGKRVRGGGYWGVPSEEAKDLAAWIDLAEDRGFKKVVLVGHSAGWAAVRTYQAEKQDPRVVGLISASGAVYPSERSDSNMLAQATRLVADGRGDDLLRFPAEHRAYPSFVSAATYLDIAQAAPELTDFFGIRTSKPAVTRVRCPILAWFGTKDDVGTAKDLDVVKSSIQRQSSGPSRVDTVMIQHADHMYTGEEVQIAQTIAKWADSLLPPE